MHSHLGVWTSTKNFAMFRSHSGNLLQVTFVATSCNFCSGNFSSGTSVAWRRLQECDQNIVNKILPSTVNRWNIIKAHGNMTIKQYITFGELRKWRVDVIPSFYILMSLQVELFNAIHSNGYHLIYLSARAIGQAGYTKEFLRKVRRGKASLPDGPLFLAPFSLYTAFKR